MHQEAGGTACIFQDLVEHVRISKEDYAAKGGDFMGDIDYEIHSKISKVKP